ncbi:hypothetical protein DAEQUDRAFT_686800 [Daedalea quercina L-15889]|uniref:Uncharacterized protein n=1 Tax=Daedalea quercina L-15889 TaxID=1314783 RepID=A0A165SGJ0_9APHY|nr:hypothetical protein DAEQUDRAFT_686800 [Daedalea quercina L-15889]
MEYLLPRLGTYLVVQLDPVQMVEPLHDPVLSAAAQQLRTQKYVGHMFEFEELPMPDRPDQKCCIALVGQGPCAENQDSFIEPTMCVPISPETEHPLSREPLQPMPPFPFARCYQYTFAIAEVRVKTGRFNHENAVSLDPHYTFTHKMYVSEDSRKRRALRDAKAGIVPAPCDDASSSSSSSDGRTLTSAEIRELASQGMPVFRTNSKGALIRVEFDAPAPQEHEPVILPSHSGPSSTASEVAPETVVIQAELANEHPHANGHLEENTDSAGGSSSPDALHEEQGDGESTSSVSMIRSISDRSVEPSSPMSDILMQAFFGDPSEDRIVIPLVNVSLDLSGVTDIPDPNAFFDEIKQIVRLIHESRERYTASGGDSGCLQSVSESWVDLAEDTASSDQDESKDTRSKFHQLLDSAKFDIKIRARRVRRHCIAMMCVVKAIVTCSFTVHVDFTLDTD